MSLLMGELDSIARCAAQYRSERLAALGLKSCHASYLMGICDCPGISQEQLARRIYQNKSSVARQLAVLEEAGFVRRVCCDSDRRVTELYPTERAKAALPEIRQVLGGVPLDTPEVLSWIEGYIQEGMESLHGGA